MVNIVGPEKGLVAVERSGRPIADIVASNPLLGPFVGSSLFMVPQPVMNDISSTKMRYGTP